MPHWQPMHTPSDADLHVGCTLSLLSCSMVLTYIFIWVLIFAWVVLLIATGLIGTYRYIHRVLVFDGYLYFRVYGMAPHV